MKRQDHRLVEYKNYSTGLFKKGLFHLWEKKVNDDGSENHIAIIEDFSTGEIKKNDSNDIRFMTHKESSDVWAEFGADNMF